MQLDCWSLRSSALSRARVCGLLWCVGALAACVDRGPGPQPQRDVGFAATHVLPYAPNDLKRQDIAMGGYLVYLGNRSPTQAIAPGARFTITHYWQVVAPPPEPWRIFVHLRGAAATPDFVNADQSPLRRAYPLHEWRRGEIIEDPQEVIVPAQWQSATMQVVAGLIPRGKHAVADRAVVHSSRAVDQAVTVAEIAIDLGRAPPPPGTVRVRHASDSIVIDGVAAEQSWAEAASSPEFLVAENSPEVAGSARARMTWDAEYLYLLAEVTDNDVFSEFKATDDPLWKADCVEMFIDADGNRAGYIELQWNPNNARFDSWFATTRAQPGDTSYDSGARSAVVVRGTGDVAGDRDSGWTVEVAIPWAAMAGKAPATVALPPKPGDRWKLNVVRVDKRGDTVTASSWNRITYADFHALDRMLTVVFADERPPGAPAPDVNASGVSSGQSPEAGAGERATSPSHAPPGAPMPSRTAAPKGSIAPTERLAPQPQRLAPTPELQPATP